MTQRDRGDRSALPAGPTPEPVPFPHFPSRLHTFVWRNWQLVPTATLAQVVGAEPEQIRAVGASLGLERPPAISPDQLRRTHLTVIRRNWHLLPYDQLLELLNCSAEELAYTLREDDFFYVKLGLLKPACEPLRYAPPTPAEERRAAEIAALVRGYFPAGVDDPGSLLQFVSDLSRPPSAPSAPVSDLPNRFAERYCCSYFSLYGDPLLDLEAAGYPDGYLARLAEAGVNGIWLQAILYRMAPYPWDPARSEGWEQRLENLQTLIATAARHGIGVFLYLNEPRAMPLPFFHDRPELRGVTALDHATLCTSVPAVREWITGAVAGICRAAPEVRAFFSISASENLTNCWSHHRGEECPRCGPRGAAEVLAEVLGTFRKGILQGCPDATRPRPRLIAWDWGWRDGEAVETIRRLPSDVDVMSVSEWSIPTERGGVPSEVGEYSLSVIGPGPRARRHWQAARDTGHRVLAKIQAASTWELSAIPAIPVVENTAVHAARLAREGVEGLMLGWTLGGYPSANLEVVAEVGRGPEAASPEEAAAAAMERVALRRCGPVLAPAVVEAWRTWSRSFQEFPYHGGLVYSAPLQVGPANLLWEQSTGYRATMVGIPYDDLDSWRRVYPPDVFVQQMERVASGFREGITTLRERLAGSNLPDEDPFRAAVEEELLLAEVAGLHFQSVANQARFVLHRDRGAESDPAAAERRQAIRELLDHEIRLAQRLHTLQTRDSRIGFEGSNQYFYVPLDLGEKVVNCAWLRERQG